jgi:hypothetical protein
LCENAPVSINAENAKHLGLTISDFPPPSGRMNLKQNRFSIRKIEDYRKFLMLPLKLMAEKMRAYYFML